jgi:AraC-like DNA-binding protein
VSDHATHRKKSVTADVRVISRRLRNCGSTSLTNFLREGRRAALRSGQTLDEIARASGFLDYAHFSRKFRARFGHPPSLHGTSEPHEK